MFLFASFIRQYFSSNTTEDNKYDTHKSMTPETFEQTIVELEYYPLSILNTIIDVPSLQDLIVNRIDKILLDTVEINDHVIPKLPNITSIKLSYKLFHEITKENLIPNYLAIESEFLGPLIIPSSEYPEPEYYKRQIDLITSFDTSRVWTEFDFLVSMPKSIRKWLASPDIKIRFDNGIDKDAITWLFAAKPNPILEDNLILEKLLPSCSTNYTALVIALNSLNCRNKWKTSIYTVETILNNTSLPYIPGICLNILDEHEFIVFKSLFELLSKHGLTLKTQDPKRQLLHDCDCDDSCEFDHYNDMRRLLKQFYD